MNRFIRLVGVPLLLAPLTAGCATKKYVSREVSELNDKVAALASEVETTQDRTKRNETRIEEVDRNARSGLTEAKGSANQALQTAQEAGRAAKGKLLYTLALSTDKVTFAFDRSNLSEEAKALVAEVLAPIVADNRGVYLEIEGHTDSSGPEAYNRWLARERALAVRDYLHDGLGIALSRMEVIAYGSSKPLVDNGTRASRAKNRRVVINVLE